MIQERAANRLLDLPDQGTVASWIYNGLKLRFNDWQFIHRARLNVVPTKQNISRWDDDANAMCRVCNTGPETLPHILCHCPTNMVKIRARHDLIVSRLANSIRFGDVRLDQQVVRLDDACRPDILIENRSEVTVIDITLPFENGADALQAAEDRKIQKYAHIIHHFTRMGKTCRVFGFVVASLAIHCGQRY